MHLWRLLRPKVIEQTPLDATADCAKALQHLLGGCAVATAGVDA